MGHALKSKWIKLMKPSFAPAFMICAQKYYFLSSHLFTFSPFLQRPKYFKVASWIVVIKFLHQWVAIFRKSLDGLNFSPCRWGLGWLAHIADSSRWDYDWEFVHFLLCLCQCHEASGEEIQPVHFWTSYQKNSSMFII